MNIFSAFDAKMNLLMNHANTLVPEETMKNKTSNLNLGVIKGITLAINLFKLSLGSRSMFKFLLHKP